MRIYINHFSLACRNLIRSKVYTGINVLGLALGLCACITLFVVIHYERSFDTFHPDGDRVYRVIGNVRESTGDVIHLIKLPTTVARSARTELAGVETAAGIIPIRAKADAGGQHFDAQGAAITEGQYFDILPYTWLAGDKETALAAPYSVVLTSSAARRYFGNLDPSGFIGLSLVYDDSVPVHVTGIVEDWTQPTDLGFKEFISYGTLQNTFWAAGILPDTWDQGTVSTWTFVKLAPHVGPAALNAGLKGLVDRHNTDKLRLSLQLEPLRRIHYDRDLIENPTRTADMTTLYALMGIALFILLLAVVNFVNLATAQSIRRAKEVSVRKVLGSSRTSLVVRYLIETGLMVGLALLLAVALVTPVLTVFRDFLPGGVRFHPSQPAVLAFLLCAGVGTTLLAGLYPARVISSYTPALHLRDAGVERGGEKWLLRKGLIVFQFTVSLVFIIGSIVIAHQLKYAREKDLGFASDAVVTIGTPGADSLSKIGVLAERLRGMPGISRLAVQWTPPLESNGRGMRLRFTRQDVLETGVAQIAADTGFIPLYQVRLLAGRNLLPSDSTREFVINETLARVLGVTKPFDALGRMLYWNGRPYPVVGVVADFHERSMHDPILPMCLLHRVDRERTLVLKLATKGMGPGAVQALLSRIGTAWKEVYPDQTFAYQFYDDALARLYEEDQKTGWLMNTAMGVAILISCIGLFGLSLFTAEKRTKEIGIRKILGARVTDIMLLLNREFVGLVLVALAVASPIAWYMMHRWLQGFAYRIGISAWIFLLAGLAAVVIALGTVSYQALRVALRNPVKSLRTE
ncbi:ABC transporter permease [Dinghuibacter silviterrae]|uniref:ABC-type antimicrobial peptide transport system permease subunit n=1 Tax=Dinghuibacter silviterrae TaxID=1539049 RepID=A0A4R8DY19_9BACT|nr:ABC transporter permease [Dinghuibacter silviterrae]TDX02347.1 ABC-type antimicrobial peptide transport system permease subunit [Dinghuibacter silviterrae]